MPASEDNRGVARRVAKLETRLGVAVLIILAASLWILAGTSPAQEAPSDPAPEGPGACSEAVTQAQRLNGPALFRGASVCFEADRRFDGSFLMLAGQVRAMTDMTLLRPSDDRSEIAAAELYGFIYARAGGAGDDALYRDPAATRRLLERVEAWQPAFFDRYDPGWAYKPLAEAASYEATAREVKAHRIAQLQGYAQLIRRDDYYEASQELARLQAANPDGFDAESEDGRRAMELTELMWKLGREAETPPPPRGSEAFRFEPDPDADYEQLHVGFNGPARPHAAVFETEDAARASWLAKALKEAELAALLSKVDFETQVLVAFSVGERTTATGALYVTDVRYNAILESFSVSGRVGVNQRDCGLAEAKSYPFALAAAKRPPVVPGYPSFSVSNFGDGCRPPKSGDPAEPRRASP